jgi:tetratricopeptide (TPR) repeat protein
MNSIKRVFESLDIKAYYKKLNNKTKFFEPTLIITMTLLFALVVISGMKSIMGETNTVIASNAAQEYYYEGKYDEAISEYERMQSKEEWPSYKLRIAEIYSLKGDYQKSNNLLKEVVILRNRLILDNSKYIEEDKEFINDVVFTFYMNGEFEEAITLGEDYLLNTNYYKPLVRTLFSIYLSSGQVDKAKNIIANYPLDQESAHDLSNFSKMQMMVGDFDDGLITLKKAWEKNSNEINIFDTISEVVSYNKNEIISRLNKLSEDNPNEAFYKLLIAKVYSLSKETVGLADEIINSVDEKDSFLSVNIIKAQIFISENKNSDAKKVIERIIDSSEDLFIVDYLNSWICYNEGDYIQAYEYAKKSILANEDYDNTWGLLIPQIMIALDKVDAAEGYFRIALSKDPINYNMILKVADYYKAVKLNYDKAKEYYSLALQINPNNQEIYYTLASNEILKENYEGAVELLESAVSKNVADIKCYRALGNVYLKLGENEKAIENIRNAYALDENDSLALNNAAYYYLIVENDIWRSYSNMEAAYNESSIDLDEESKLIIEENYNKVKAALDQYIESEETILNTPELQILY